MAVPEYQSFMLPLLQLASDQKVHALSEAYDILAKQFGLNQEDLEDILPSGRQSRFENRVGWARTYLKKAGLIDSTGRGKFSITSRGLEVLRRTPTLIDKDFLMQFPEFREFQSRQNSAQEDSKTITAPRVETPDEILDSAYQILRHTLAQDLLEKVRNSSPKFFEGLVVDLLVAMGYGGSRADAGEVVGRTSDGGIDGLIKEDKLGLDTVYLQAKRWKDTVGRPIVQAFVGSLAGQKARKGVLITTSQFSQEASDYINTVDMKIVLIDGELLAQLMIDHDIGVASSATYTIKRLDLDYFGEE